MTWALALLKRAWLPLLLMALVAYILVAAYGRGLQHGDARTERLWQARWNEQVATLAIERANAVQAARDEEQRRYVAINEAAENARETDRQIDRDAAERSADDGLRRDAATVAEHAAQCPRNSAAPDRSAATTRAAMVLTDLLERSLETNRELAEAYDRVRNAAVTCNAAYDSLNP